MTDPPYGPARRPAIPVRVTAAAAGEPKADRNIPDPTITEPGRPAGKDADE